MIELRPFNGLGGENHGWLDAKHHFSFANYHDPARMGWGALRVWNDDTIQPNSGFPPHPHRNMEIITYVRKGAITHEDNLGNKGRTEAGDVQVMSAGSGIVHSEANLEDEATQIFQIWILPTRAGEAAALGNAAVSERRARRRFRDARLGRRGRRRPADPRRRAGRGGDAESRRKRRNICWERTGAPIWFRRREPSKSTAFASPRATVPRSARSTRSMSRRSRTARSSLSTPPDRRDPGARRQGFAPASLEKKAGGLVFTAGSP